MKKKLGLCGGILIAIAFCFLFALQEKNIQTVSEDKYVIGVVTKSGTSEYWMSVCSGMEAAAREVGAEMLFLFPDSEVNGEAQTKMVETLIHRGVDVLAVSPIDSGSGHDYFSMARDSGIPLISYDTPFIDEGIPYIGIDNEKAGYELAAFLAEEMGHTGEVGIVAGDFNQLSHKERMEGFMRYMDSEEGMKVSFVESGYSNRRMSEKEMKRIRKQYPGVKGIMATSAVTALGMVEGIGEDEIKIVSIDAQEDALAALENGKIAALVAQSGYEIGYETVRYIHDMKMDVKADTRLILNAELLTKENVKAYAEKKTKEHGELRLQ